MIAPIRLLHYMLNVNTVDPVYSEVICSQPFCCSIVVQLSEFVLIEECVG